MESCLQKHGLAHVPQQHFRQAGTTRSLYATTRQRAVGRQGSETEERGGNLPLPSGTVGDTRVISSEGQVPHTLLERRRALPRARYGGTSKKRVPRRRWYGVCDGGFAPCDRRPAEGEGEGESRLMERGGIRKMVPSSMRTWFDWRADMSGLTAGMKCWGPYLGRRDRPRPFLSDDNEGSWRVGDGVRELLLLRMTGRPAFRFGA